MSENETQNAAEEKAEETTAAATDESTAAVEAKTEETEVKAETAEAKEETAESKPEAEEAKPEAEEEEISYHAVEKEGEISAIWEMQGKKHIRTISARSAEGQKILSLFTSEIHETDSPAMAEDASA
ncbi:MAG: hypothetical protein DWQ47_08030 [Acidobacteria bacterium]|nr:MAG: hypothetical protein DWQ32_16130 [Acidobacteriota bacterium]REJ99138.1 MAG: hypothetical protein DWQ38_13845 [Acidobacteriota bacterium]REK16141.1 MAG: hypothetical protein DWQ43_03840 [Acidobacteriota bacterium]REK43822.1 MAG: hypothetical protein DWQ47_08030 [Acidobacteriota bacterium]